MFWLIKLFGLENLFYWVKPTFEQGGKASMRRLTAFVVMALYSYTHVSIIDDNQYKLYVMILDMIFFCVLVGIVTSEALLAAYKDRNNGSSDNNVGNNVGLNS